jgi:hypothetical protein
MAGRRPRRALTIRRFFCFTPAALVVTNFAETLARSIHVIFPGPGFFHERAIFVATMIGTDAKTSLSRRAHVIVNFCPEIIIGFLFPCPIVGLFCHSKHRPFIPFIDHVFQTCIPIFS